MRKIGQSTYLAFISSQACGYKIGEIKILELRKKAEKELGTFIKGIRTETPLIKTTLT